MIKNKKAVIFDLDGSLVDSMWIWRQIDIEYLGRYGIELPENLQKEIEGMSFYQTAVYFKNRFDIKEPIEEIMDIWNAMAEDKYLHDVKLKTGAREFLDYCRCNNILLGVATSNSRELVTHFMRANELEDYFTCIMTGSEVTNGKPAPDIYIKVSEELKVKPADCLVFEDIVPGIMAGKNAGMVVCAVYDEYSAKETEEKKALADYYIQNYNNIFMQTYEVLK